MARSCHVNHIQVVIFDQTIHVHVNQIQTGSGAPMSEQSRFHMFKFKRLFEQRIVHQINLTDRQIIGGAPVSIHLVEFDGGQRLFRTSLGGITSSGHKSPEQLLKGTSSSVSRSQTNIKENYFRR